MPPTEEDPFAEHTAEANTCILWHTSSLDAERVFRKLYLILGLCSSHGPGLSEASDAKLFRVYLHLLVQDILDFQQRIPAAYTCPVAGSRRFLKGSKLSVA